MRFFSSTRTSFIILGILGAILLASSAFLPHAIVSSTGNILRAEAIGPFLNGNLPSTGASGDIGVESIWGGLNFESPLALAFHPSLPHAFVAQRDGKIFRVHTETYARSLALDLSGQVAVCVDGGMMGLVLHPDVEKTGSEQKPYFYVYYATRDSLGGHEPTSLVHVPCWRPPLWYGSYLILSRWEFDPETLEILPNSELIMIRRRLFNSVHRGGGLTFGTDGFLYLTTGDQGIQRPSQELDDNLDGAVIRIDVDRDPNRSHPAIYTLPKRDNAPDEISGVGYFIPNSNPFVGDSATLEEYYAIGFRNPHRMTTDPVSGQIFIGDVGSWKQEEINILVSGGNYGWPVYEGGDTNNYCIDWLYQDSIQRLPLVSMPRNIANSITGGYVYRGTEVPALYGKYICGDYGDGKELFAVNPVSGAYTMLDINSPGRPIAFGQDKHGEVYMLNSGNGPIYRFKTTNSNFSPPPTLSQAGVFNKLETLEPTPGLIPYALNVPFWSDGAEKYRWMAIPNDGAFDNASEYIQFNSTSPWQFPVGTVFVKHFEWKTQRLETRLFIQGEDQQWYGLSYRWREDQLDADLVQEGHQDTLNIAPGVQKTWYFPGRNECLTCHDAAAGSVLGPGTSQLNGEWVYPGSAEACNQLEALNRIGIFDTLLDEQQLDQLPVSASSTDTTFSLDARARAYLDANCSYCHQPATGNRAEFDLRLYDPAPGRDIVLASLNDNLGVMNAHAITPGFPDQSIALHRMKSLESGIAMPPLAKNQIDDEGVRLIEAWILSMRETPPPNSAYIRIFPNPAQSIQQTYVALHNFDPGTKQLRISDMNGKTIWETHIETVNTSEEYPLGTSQGLTLDTGVYLVQVFTKKEVYSKRLLIQ